MCTNINSALGDINMYLLYTPCRFLNCNSFGTNKKIFSKEVLLLLLGTLTLKTDNSVTWRL